MLKRRQLLKHLGTLPLVGGLFSLPERLDVKPAVNKMPGVRRDYFKELGVRTFINAAGTYTAMTSCLMHEEVIDAYLYASNQFVNLDELHDRVGERIADLVHCEGAMVTAGAASAITLGVAGVLTGLDAGRADRIPNDLTGMKSEVIIQKTHRVGYDHAIRNTGVKLIEVETAKEMEAAINEKTALMWFLNANNYTGKVQWDEFVRIAKKYNIPTMNDCAADVPPVENLWKYTGMGFDLVCFSGGKGLRGPQSAGLLLGKKDLIKAARLNAPPNGSTIGRGMKVNKEEMLAMLVTVESYLTRDHAADWKLWEHQVKVIADAVVAIPGVVTTKHVPDVANHVPSLKISWDQNIIKMNGDDARNKLRFGHPSIQTVGDKDSLGITTWMLNPGEERIVAKRVKEILSGM